MGLIHADWKELRAFVICLQDEHGASLEKLLFLLCIPLLGLLLTIIRLLVPAIG